MATTLVEELERAAEAEERQVNRVSFHAELLRTAAAMITALKEETLSLLNKPELPLRLEDWEVCWQPWGADSTFAHQHAQWLISVNEGGYVWAKRRASRPEMPTLSEEP